MMLSASPFSGFNDMFSIGKRDVAFVEFENGELAEDAGWAKFTKGFRVTLPRAAKVTSEEILFGYTVFPPPLSLGFPF